MAQTDSKSNCQTRQIENDMLAQDAPLKLKHLE